MEELLQLIEEEWKKREIINAEIREQVIQEARRWTLDNAVSLIIRNSNRRKKTMEKKEISSDVTTLAIEKARHAIEDIMAEVIQDPEFDPDMFVSNICYWYEFQQLAKAYGKKLIYFTPKKKKF